MPRYAAFLRGINLGPTNKVAMPRLRALAEGLGFTDVRSHLNSGNLVFTATGTPSELTEALQLAITSEFGLRIDVAVRTGARLGELLAGNPFPGGDPSQVTVAFLTASPPPDAEQRVAALARPEEEFRCCGLEVWVNYASGQGNSRLAAQFSRVVGVSATVRNVRTVTKVVELLR